MRRIVGSRLRRLLADPDVAIDLGTANTRIFALDVGLIADEPSLVPGVAGAREGAPRPLRGGVVVDLRGAASLLGSLLVRSRRLGLIAPRALVCVPTDATARERAALEEAARLAGAAAVALVPEPVAAAVGAGMDIAAPQAQLLVDIGDGVTDIAVIRWGRLVASSAVRKACSDLHAAVGSVLAAHAGFPVPAGRVERLTAMMGVDGRWHSGPLAPEAGPGRALLEEAAEAMRPVVDCIVEAVGAAVAALPPETSCEVIETGCALTGGGALLPGMDRLIAARTGLAVRRVRDPMRAVIDGAAQMLGVGARTGLWDG